MSARYPRAIWKPLPEAGKEYSATRRRLLIFHTIVGSAQGAFDYFANSTSLESHMIAPKVGPMWQIMEFSDSADANYRANDIAISVETEDNRAPATDPWTQNQLDELVAFGIWCVQNPEFDIPAKRATAPFGEGIGYHAMFGAPSDWTPSTGKTCPAAARIRQFNEIVLPRIISGDAPPSAPSQEDALSIADIYELYRSYLGREPESIDAVHAWWSDYRVRVGAGASPTEAAAAIEQFFYDTAKAG